MNVCETVCVISSGASQEEVDHVQVYDIRVYGDEICCDLNGGV